MDLYCEKACTKPICLSAKVWKKKNNFGPVLVVGTLFQLKKAQNMNGVDFEKEF